MTEILKTQNKTWGFWGTASNHIEHKKEMQAFWDKAAEIIQSKGLTPQQTLGLMDSRWGVTSLTNSLKNSAPTWKHSPRYLKDK